MRQDLTAREIEDAKGVAATLWPDINMPAVTIDIMPMPEPDSHELTSSISVSDTIGIVFSQGYSFAFHPLSYRLWIGKEENHIS
jgi:hypothetical protein